MTKSEFLGVYGDVEVTFRLFSNNGVMYSAKLEDGSLLFVSFVGTADDVIAGDIQKVSDLNPISGSVHMDGIATDSFRDF